MTVTEIIKAVRWCIDEESDNNSSMADVIDEKDDSYMDNIIKSNISCALRWVCVTAPSSLLLDSSAYASNPTSSLVKTYTFKSGDSGYDTTWNSSLGIGKITISSANWIRPLRIRGDDWYKAIMTPVEEDSEEELAMFDTCTMGTKDRPQAAIIRGSSLGLLVQPSSNTIEVTVICSPSVSSTIAGDADISIPESVTSSFLYYLAFLLLSAYDDTRANQMYAIALQQLGISQQSKT